MAIEFGASGEIFRGKKLGKNWEKLTNKPRHFLIWDSKVFTILPGFEIKVGFVNNENSLVVVCSCDVF